MSSPKATRRFQAKLVAEGRPSSIFAKRRASYTAGHKMSLPLNQSATEKGRSTEQNVCIVQQGVSLAFQRILQRGVCGTINLPTEYL